MILLVAIVKDELDLTCWIDYHLTIGIDKIVIWDDFSVVPFFYDDERVEIKQVPENWRNVEGRQEHFYAETSNEHHNIADWIICLDADEYIVFNPKENLKDILNDYIEYTAVGANWLMFGSNNFIERPLGRVFDNYILRSEQEWFPNRHIKSFFQPKFALKFITSHLVVGLKPTVNENKIVINTPIVENTDSTSNRLWINHYHHKSEQNYRMRIKRGAVDGIQRDMKRFFDELPFTNLVKDLRAKKLYYTKKKEQRNENK